MSKPLAQITPLILHQRLSGLLFGLLCALIATVHLSPRALIAQPASEERPLSDDEERPLSDDEERPLSDDEERPLSDDEEPRPSSAQKEGQKAPQQVKSEAGGTAVSPKASREVGAERALPNERVALRQRAPSRLGATGLAEVLSADTGPQGTIRLGFQFGGFSSDEFLTPGVEERFVGTRANLAYTPHELVELFVSARSLSHTNPLSSPTTIQSQGDMNLGAKSGMFWGSFGAALALDLQLFSAPDGWWDLDATSANLHGLLTYDLNRGEAPVPFRFLFHGQYTVERSEALFDELPELPSLVQEWAYQAGYYNRLFLRFGVEAPFERVSPFLEYHIGTPFEVEMPRMGKFSRVFAFESIPQSINAGLRAFVIEGLTAELVTTLGRSDAPFTGVPATPPWALWAGLSYSLDPRPEIVEREIKITPPAPKPPAPKPLGSLLSLTILDQRGAPISGARLTYLNDQQRAAQLTDERGLATGYRFSQKKLTIEISAEGYRTRRLSLKLKTQDQPTKGKIKLKPSPKAKPSSLQLSLSQLSAPGEEPTALSEELQGATFELALHGPELYKGVVRFGSDPLKVKLKPGEYALSLSLAGELKFQRTLTLSAGATYKQVVTPSDLISGRAEAKPAPKSRKPKKKRGAKKRARGAQKGGLVSFDRGRGSLKVKRKITFKGDSARLSAQGLKVTDAVAKRLKGERSLRTLTVYVHTHSVGSPAADKKLGAQRGEAIRSRLSQRGLSASKVKVVSLGSSQSVAPNITSAGRSRNQRVTFKVTLKD